MDQLKKITIILFISCIRGPITYSQEIKVTTYAGMTIGRTVDNYHFTEDFYKGYIEGGWRYGIGVGLLLENAYDLELLYYYQDTKVPTVYYTGGTTIDRDFNLSIHWILLAFTAYLSKKMVKPFFGPYIGAGILNLRGTSTSLESTRAKFTWGGSGGVEFSVGKFIALKLKADLLFSARLDHSPDDDDIAAYNDYLQTGFSAGFVVRLPIRLSKK